MPEYLIKGEMTTLVVLYVTGIVVNSAYALLTMTVTYKSTNVVISPFIRYSGTSAYIGAEKRLHKTQQVYNSLKMESRDSTKK